MEVCVCFMVIYIFIYIHLYRNGEVQLFYFRVHQLKAFCPLRDERSQHVLWLIDWLIDYRKVGLSEYSTNTEAVFHFVFGSSTNSFYSTRMRMKTHIQTCGIVLMRLHLLLIRLPTPATQGWKWFPTMKAEIQRWISHCQQMSAITRTRCVYCCNIKLWSCWYGVRCKMPRYPISRIQNPSLDSDHFRAALFHFQCQSNETTREKKKVLHVFQGAALYIPAEWCPMSPLDN